MAVLLNAGVTFHFDPVTDITEGSDSPEVQQAILRFLHRSEHTNRSLAQTINTLADAQPQNPQLNADILRLLDSSDPMLRVGLLQYLPRLTLPPTDFTTAEAYVAQMASDPSAWPEFRTTAKTILPCWDNDRHHACQSMPNAVNVP